MQDFVVTLESEPSRTFRCQKAANSLDIDIAKKLRHELRVSADLAAPFNVGLIVGASGSGKTTLAKSIWGADCFKTILKPDKPVIDQFPEGMAYDDCVAALTGVGLNSVPCWIRPAATLSNGQRARAEIALQMARDAELIVIDEWTSVVDRTVAKVMSYCIQKHARRTGRQVVLASCHFDVIEWIDPDWIIDCNTQSYEDRRGLQRGQRDERLTFELAEVDKSTWRYFSRYHYLSERLPVNPIAFGLFKGADQIGFVCFANYVPHSDKSKKRIMHSNRVVVHPDYQGFGLGIRMATDASRVMYERGYDVRAKFSSVPMLRSRLKHPNWEFLTEDRDHKQQVSRTMGRSKTGMGSFRLDVRTYSFRFRPTPKDPVAQSPGSAEQAA